MNTICQNNMTHVYAQCLLPARRGSQDRDAVPCLALHRVQWIETLESANSESVLCHFRAPDAESMLCALRRLKIDVAAIWIQRSVDSKRRVK